MSPLDPASGWWWLIGPVGEYLRSAALGGSVARRRAALDVVDRPTLLYDGECRLCQGTVRFVRARLRRDAEVAFVPVPSDEGRRLLTAIGRAPAPFHSVVLIEPGRFHERSSAVLRAARSMRWPWSWLRVLRVVPRPLRDAVYDAVSRNRYRLSGGKGRPQCACGDEE